MTLPYERRNAIINTRNFLVSLLNPKTTPKVPSAIRREASRLLKHFPNEYDMENAGREAPKVFGDPDVKLAALFRPNFGAKKPSDES